MAETSVQVTIGGVRALVVADGGTIYTFTREGPRIAIQKGGQPAYWISRLGICSCPAGQNGKPCKHLGWAEDLP